MSHTPGPYEIDAREDSDWIFIQTAIGGVEVARVEADYWSRSSHHQKLASANARLLAAAPDLLDAIKESADALADIINAANNGFPYSPTELVKLFADIRCRADAAYEKATGEKA